MFPQTTIGNIKTNLPFVLQAMHNAGIGDKPMLLMALGTIRAETASFEPISEGRSRFNTSPNGHPFDLYDNRRDLGNRGEPDGDRYKGRGFVQLTGRAHYTTFSAQLGMGTELVDHPDKANDPTIASQLLALFLKDKEQRSESSFPAPPIIRSFLFVPRATLHNMAVRSVTASVLLGDPKSPTPRQASQGTL
jgi:peptidoglycan L-alanyl-D-glutamate endopeptidase CwlK